MALKLELTIFVYVFVALRYSVTASQSEVEILSETGTVIEANNNFTVLCQGKKPLKWTVPNVPDDKRFWTTFVSTFEKPVDQEFQYGSRLTIINMTYPFVGFYYCHYTDADGESKTESKKIYLYVNDIKHLSTLDIPVKTVFVAQYGEVLIPCIPTSPDVRVDLSLMFEEVSMSEGKDWYRYDPMYGYLTNDTPIEQGFICNFTKEGTTHFEVLDTYVEKVQPFIRELRDSPTVAGDQLELQCVIPYPSHENVTVHWMTPNGPVDDTRMNTSSRIETYFALTYRHMISTLIIYKTIKEDEGSYGCNVSDTRGHNFLLSVDVKIYASRSDKEVEILSEFGTVIEANDNFTVLCQGKKPLNWTVPNVPDDKRFWTTFLSTFEKPVVQEFQYGSRLTIINMTYPFVGFYYCHYTNADEESKTESAKIYLYVNDNKHLSTLDNPVKTVFVARYGEVLIPCIPTSSDVHVDLSLTSKEASKSKGRIYRYDPMYGFLTDDRQGVQTFTCVFTKKGTTHFEEFEIYVKKVEPVIRDLSHGLTVAGDQFELQCDIPIPYPNNENITVYWITPKGPVDDTRMNTSIRIETYPAGKDIRYRHILSTLILYKTTMEDTGRYGCSVNNTRGQNFFLSIDVKIYGPNDYYINLNDNDDYSLVAPAGQLSVKWEIHIKAFPKVTKVEWLNNKNKTIGGETKYYTDYSYNTALLRINNITITDFGIYTLIVSNDKIEKTLSHFLNVTDKPFVRIESVPFHLINTNSTVKCYAYASPEPEFEWKHKNCHTSNCSYFPINGTITKREGYEYISEVNINASESGYIKCLARNSLGFSQTISRFYVSDIRNGFDLFGLDSTVDVNEETRTATIVRDDPISVICGVSSIPNHIDIDWFHNEQILANDDKYKLTKSYTKYSKRLKLELSQASYTDGGLYSCRITKKNGDYLYKNISFNVVKPEEPRIYETNMIAELEMDLPKSLVMYCKVLDNLILPATVKWYKDGVLFNSLEPKRIMYDANNEILTFLNTDAKDAGTYMCEARNRIGVDSRTQTVNFTNLPRAPTWSIFIITFLVILFIAAIVFIGIKLRKEKQQQRQLKELGLQNFEKGAVENINPELGIDDQAELLPYSRKWEYPIEYLKLGEQLGSGAFGVVMKGTATNIIKGECISTVAVKMVKRNTDNTCIRALASELKIMIHLGKHLNIVNLLGACTRKVAKRELLVIFEYCRFGNLQNYLLRHRDNYINQVDPKTGKINDSIGQEFLNSTYPVSSDGRNSYQILLSPNNTAAYRANPNNDTSINTEMTNVAQDESLILNNDVRPEFRSNYKGDYKENVRPICTKDLLVWAFQVTRGMEYLASRKVLHGDLAARNILLTDNNIIKICDFGLAKSMYKTEGYQKGGNNPLPIKWMAIESIRDRVFSTQSDVWSFGIVLWEFFSLARTPYPGIEADERLYQKLVDGYRMESPDYATREIYKIMTDCWAPTPLARPSFTKLTETIGALLDDTLRIHYIDLNNPYLIMNTQRLADGETDYLAMLNPSTSETLGSAQYVNDSFEQESVEDSGYLNMKPNRIYSPKTAEDKILNFNVNNHKHLTSMNENELELLPKLRRQSESDCNAPVQCSISSTNPTKETRKTADNNTEIFKSVDNYVNMSQI